MEFSRKLKILMAERDVKGTALAARIGVKQQQVSRWTNAKTVPDINEARALANYFRVSLDWLCDPEADYPPPAVLGPPRVLTDEIQIDVDPGESRPRLPRRGG
jgi:transcriptional regulator with XRE-family HTH domain